MLYYKRHWDENPGGKQSHWGTSDWYFEVGQDGYAVRQIEVYQSGIVLKYQAEQEDEFGFLTDAVLDPQEYEPYCISANEFESIWHSTRALNQPDGLTTRCT